MVAVVLPVLVAIVVKKLVDWLKPFGVTGELITPVVAWVLGIVLTWIAVQLNAPGTHGIGNWVVGLLGILAGSVGSLIHDTQTAISGHYTPVEPRQEL